MATLKSRIRWKKWAPDLGENRTLEGGPALYLELATDLTAQQLEEAAAKLTARGEPVTTRDELLASMRARFSEALGPYVRVHGGPHTVDGQPLATFDDYLALVTQGAGLGASQLRELQAAPRERGRPGRRAWRRRRRVADRSGRAPTIAGQQNRADAGGRQADDRGHRVGNRRPRHGGRHAHQGDGGE